MVHPQIPLRSAAALAAASVLLVGGCARQAPPAAAPAPTSTQLAGTGSADPLASSPVPSPATSSPFTWPKPTTPTVTPGLAPRGGIDVAKVDRSDPEEVARAFTVLAYTVDARTDATPAAGGTRAAALATTDLAATLRSAPTTRGDLTWKQLVDRRGYTTVTTQENVDDGKPVGSATQHTVSIVVTVTATPMNTRRQLVVYLALTRPSPSAPWAVAKMKAAG